VKPSDRAALANVRLPDSRLRTGGALISAGLLVAGIGWVPVSLGFAPADLAPVVTIGVGLLVFLAGTLIAGTRMTCPQCRRTYLTIGRPTRGCCAGCGAPLYPKATAERD
jgi:hypothetical protein